MPHLKNRSVGGTRLKRRNPTTHYLKKKKKKKIKEASSLSVHEEQAGRHGPWRPDTQRSVLEKEIGPDRRSCAGKGPQRNRESSPRTHGEACTCTYTHAHGELPARNRPTRLWGLASLNLIGWEHRPELMLPS